MEQRTSKRELPQLLCLKEVCAILRVSRGYVERAARSGELPGFKIGRSWRFDREDVELWIKNQYDDAIERREVQV